MEKITIELRHEFKQRLGSGKIGRDGRREWMGCITHNQTAINLSRKASYITHNQTAINLSEKASFNTKALFKTKAHKHQEELNWHSGHNL